jgi:hypothetical protein
MVSQRLYTSNRLARRARIALASRALSQEIHVEHMMMASFQATASHAFFAPRFEKLDAHARSTESQCPAKTAAR